MHHPRTPRLVTLVLVAGGLAACGNSSTGPGAHAPDDAARSAFCGSWARLTGHLSPQRTADTLGKVGTPGDIGSRARHGFEVLLARLHDLPEHAHKGDITQMARGLHGTEQQDVAAFLAYYARECRGQGGAGGS
jgi:hypothetical protein